MSKLLHLTNRLKAQASPEMLTPSQSVALVDLEKRWQFPDRVNLCGPAGAGKTFLGWVLTRQYEARFFASPHALKQEQELYPRQIIVDNAPSEEKNLRHLLAELQLRQVRNAVLISQNPNNLGLPIVTLPSPTQKDIAKIYENLNRLHFHSLESLDKENFWNIIYSVL